MRVDELDYYLPEELIAQRPAAERDKSRLMVVDRSSGAVEHTVFSNLPHYFAAGDLLVVNDSKVFPARLFGRKSSGGAKMEVLLIAEIGPGTWEVMLRPSGKVKQGTEISFGDGELMATLKERLGQGTWLCRFSCQSSVESAIEKLGRAPLPPYIKREPDAEDAVRYQTIFARRSGSVAAPTAGLHFTEPIAEALRQKGVRLAYITLHVGPGTFTPIRVEKIEDHRMRPETFHVDRDAAEMLNSASACGHRAVAVGTTAVRALESSASCGKVIPRSGRTDLFVAPGYRFQVVDAILTNYHLPRSSSLALVAAFAGLELILKAYKCAVVNGYRFYSYGDSMLII